jgi:hypothetical protein
MYHDLLGLQWFECWVRVGVAFGSGVGVGVFDGVGVADCVGCAV